MKKEDKELLLRDLSARLPYGVKVKTPNDDEVYTLLSLNPNKGIAVIGMPFDDVFATSKVKVEDIKPYLRPMLSITEEEKKELSARWLWARCLDNINLAYLCDSAKDYVACSSGEYFELQDWLNAHHFDYRGLIGKGLAFEAPEGMYNF